LTLGYSGATFTVFLVRDGPLCKVQQLELDHESPSSLMYLSHGPDEDKSLGIIFQTNASRVRVGCIGVADEKGSV
jgi:hypothetical protein